MEPPFIKFSLILDVIYNLYFLLTCYSATGPINRTQYSHLWLEHKPPRYISNTHIYIYYALFIFRNYFQGLYFVPKYSILYLLINFSK